MRDDEVHRGRGQDGWQHRHEEEGWRPRDEEDWGPHWARRRGHARGPGPGFGGRRGFGPPPVPPWMWFGEPGSRRMRGPRAKRGDVRAAALALLAEQPMNGYQIIQEIGQRSGGLWRPSPGSVYPALQQLEDEGLIRAEAGDGGRRGYVLTDEGRTYVEAHPDEVRAPWDVVTSAVDEIAIEMRSLTGQVAMAAMQVVHAGSAAQAGQARQVLADARKALYRILAADDEGQDSAQG